MNESVIYELAEALSAIAESVSATQDMLGIICRHIASAHPTISSELTALLKALQERSDIEATQAFVVVATRLQRDLSGDIDAPFLSLKKSLPSPTNPDELRARLRLIRGGKEP